MYQLDKIYTRDDTGNVGIFDDFSIALNDIFEEEPEEEIERVSAYE